MAGKPKVIFDVKKVPCASSIPEKKLRRALMAACYDLNDEAPEFKVSLTEDDESFKVLGVGEGWRGKVAEDGLFYNDRRTDE